MKYLNFVIGVVLLTGCGSAAKINQSSSLVDEEFRQAEKEMCEQVQCEYDLRVKLTQKDGSIYDMTFDAMPVVQPQGVMVLAGHSVAFEADDDDGFLTNLKLVRKVTNPEKTITAKFEQMDDGQMMLALKNPFKKPLRIKMGIMPLDSDELYATSSCPVIAGGGSYELWPEPIFQVWLGEPRLLRAGETMACIK